MDSPGFRYDTTQRAAISSHAPREFSRDDWLYLETVAANYQLAFFQTLLTKRSATRSYSAAYLLLDAIAGSAETATFLDNAQPLTVEVRYAEATSKSLHVQNP
jgi:hypothetical protein